MSATIRPANLHGPPRIDIWASPGHARSRTWHPAHLGGLPTAGNEDEDDRRTVGENPPRNSVRVKALSWLGVALLVLVVIILLAAISGIFPQTHVDLTFNPPEVVAVPTDDALLSSVQAGVMCRMYIRRPSSVRFDPAPALLDETGVPVLFVGSSLKLAQVNFDPANGTKDRPYLAAGSWSVGSAEFQRCYIKR